MRKCSLICLLLFCVLAGKAQVKKQVLMNVYAANAGLAALDGDEALRKAQLVTSNGATIEYDLAKRKSVCISICLRNMTCFTSIK